MKLIRQPELYTLPNNFLKLRWAVALIVAEIFFGVLGYMRLEGMSFLDAFYMVVITISTVGYTEVGQMSNGGRIISTILIIVNIGIFAYLLAVVSYYITSGEFFKRLHFTMIDNKIAQLENHVIVCGYGRYGQEVSEQFLGRKIPFVLVEKNEQVIEYIQHNDKKLLYLHADATKDETLKKAGIEKAKALITALPDDAENLFVVLTARQLNDKINIISRAMESRSQEKLKFAGANHVIMPEKVGGFYMAKLVNEPGATEFFTYISRDLDADVFFEEIKYENMPTNCRDMAIKDLNIRQATGSNIIAYKPPEGKYIVNPSPDISLCPNSSFIVLGNRQQLNALKEYLNGLTHSIT